MRLSIEVEKESELPMKATQKSKSYGSTRHSRERSFNITRGQSQWAGMKVREQQSQKRLCGANSPPTMPGFFTCKSAYAKYPINIMANIHKNHDAAKSIEQQYRYNQATGAKDMFSFSQSELQFGLHRDTSK